MTWKMLQRLLVRKLLRHQPHNVSAIAKNRTAPSKIQRLLIHSQVSQSSGAGDIASGSSKNHPGSQKDISAEETFRPGLFHLGISSFRVKTELLNDWDAVKSHDHEKLPKPKHPYISYGTHIDPAVFQKLSQERTSVQDGAEQEIFHPKLTPRIFYREAEEYEGTAIIFPRAVRTEMVAYSKEAQGKAEYLLNEYQFKAGIEEQDISHVLECFHGCSDEFLLRMAGDERFNTLIELLGDHSSNLTTDKFLKILTLFARFQIRTSCPVLQIFEAECEKRCPGWNIVTSLLVCDAWRLIGLPVRTLNDQIFDGIERQRNQLTKWQVVQLMYLIGENRQCKASLLSSLQEIVLMNINTLTLTELGAVCQGFFKSKTNLKPLVISALSRRVQAERLNHIHSFYLTGILKVFRQAYFGHRDLFNHIGDSISPRLRNFPISSIMHILLTYATLHTHHERLLEAGAQELIHRSHECRCKDVSKVLWSFATLNHRPKDSDIFFKTLIDRIVDLMKEYRHFPVLLVSGLLSLAYFNIYPVELLNEVFSKKFLLMIDEHAKQFSIDPQRDLFLLHSSVKIDCPEYQGNSLSKDFFMRRPFPEGMLGSLPYEMARRPILRRVASSVASVLGGEQYVGLGFILPHMKTADIEIHLDADYSPLPIDLVDRGQTSPLSLSPPPKSSPSATNSPASNRKQIVSLDLALIANLVGKGENRGMAPTGKRMAFSPPTKIGMASNDGVSDSTEVSMTPNATFCGMPATSTDEELPVDKAASSRQKDADASSTEWSRFNVPKPLCNKEPLSGNRVAILVWSRNHFHFNGKKLLGLHSMKKRQLIKLGYKTVDIPFFEWDKLTGRQAREDYIQQKIFPNKHRDNRQSERHGQTR